MQIVIDVPHSLYANLQKIHHETNAGKRVLDCVKHGRLLELVKPKITIDGKTYIAEHPKLKTVHGKTGEVVIGGFKEVDNGN